MVFFFPDCPLFLVVVVDDDDSMSSLLVIKPTFIIRCVICTMRSSIYIQWIYIFQADIVPNRSMSSSTSLRTFDKSIINRFDVRYISQLMTQIIRLAFSNVSLVLFLHLKILFVRLKYAYIDMSYELDTPAEV